MDTIKTILVMGLLMSGPVLAQDPLPIGDEFQVNSYTTEDQQAPAVGMDSAGNFVVVWSSDGSYGTDTKRGSIQGQRFGASGTPVDGEFQVNTFTTYSQFNPDVAVGPDGDFVMVWETFLDVEREVIKAQIYNSDGSAEGGEFTVSSSFNYLDKPQVGMDSGGNFVVAWEESYFVHTFSDFSIDAQLFDASGAPGKFVVVSGGGGYYIEWSDPSLAVGSDGDFVVVWRYRDFDDGTDSVFARKFDAAGDPVTGELQVDTYATALGCCPAVALDSGQGFFVVWSSEGSPGSDTDSTSIQGRLFAADGVPMGPQFQVNAYTTGKQGGPTAAVTNDGNFVVTWGSSQSGGSDQDPFSVQGQILDSSGAMLGSQFQINTYSTLDQRFPKVAAIDNGDFVVVWRSDGSYGTDSDDRSVQGQRFGGPHWIFTDGFESGDTSTWSSATQ